MIRKTNSLLRETDFLRRRFFRFLVGIGLLVSMVLGFPAVPASGFSGRSVPSPNRKAAAAEWPQFRGPDGQGHSAAIGLPLRWSEQNNIVWKRRIPGHGWSSPVIRGNQIWLTAADRRKKVLKVICVDRTTGKILYEIEAFHVERLGHVHSKNSYASPTPVLEGNRVYVHFGSLGTACLSTEGKILWRTRLPYYQHHGPAGSPVLVGKNLIIACDGYGRPYPKQPPDREVVSLQFVVALDKRTGKTRWKTVRNGSHAYCTPLLIRVDGTDQVICPGADQVVAYNPATGAPIWTCRYRGYSIVPRPVFAKGLVFLSTGFDTPTLFAVRPTGQGDVTDTQLAWHTKRGAPLTPSPVAVGNELYTVSDAGIATCFDAVTGRVHWRNRLPGPFSASPLFADGRLYFVNERGLTHVLAVGTRFHKLATNRLDGRSFASPAVAGHALYLRTEHFLYRIEKRKRKR